jgi:hypothetical protein
MKEPTRLKPVESLADCCPFFFSSAPDQMAHDREFANGQSGDVKGKGAKVDMNRKEREAEHEFSATWPHFSPLSL